LLAGEVPDMAGIRLIAAMPDRTHLDLLNGYVRAGGLAGQWTLECFTSPEALKRRFQTGEADAAVIHPPWLEELAQSGRLNARLVCAWSEEPGEERIGGFPALFKYEPANLLLARIRSMVKEQTSRGGEGEGDSGSRTGCRTIAVYSTRGGAGKTTLAVHLLELMGRRNRSVLYIGLETTPSLEIFVRSGEGADMARLLYEMGRGGGFAEALRRSMVLDAARGFHYIRPFRLAEDAEGMTAREAQELIRQVRALGLFDYVVLDLESSLHDRVKGALLAADDILWLIEDEAVCLEKTARRLEEWKRALGESWQPVSRRIGYVVCRSAGPALSAECRRIAWAVRGRLPDVPEWRRGSHAPPGAKGYAYREQLRRMCAPEGEARGAVHG